MHTLKSLTKTLILFSLLTAIYSCASERYLRTVRPAPEELAGTYTVFLYGARHMDDVENVAILDKEGDPYSIEIYAPEYDYTVKDGMPAKEALEEAQAHVRYHRDFRGSRLSKIIDKTGNTIGFELRPLYHAHRFGQSDVLYVDYMMKDNKVITTIRVKDYIPERDREMLRGSD
ncbi:MAG: hypothetical protein HZC49_07240 [Nitrospirae bacterium]|nr:hypothetical protein [Nitrospirota bacterium]